MALGTEYFVYKNYGYSSEELLAGPCDFLAADDVFQETLDELEDSGEAFILDVAWFTKDGEYDTRITVREGEL